MRDAMAWLAGTGVQHVILTCSEKHAEQDVRSGRPTAHLPPLTSSDKVYAAGAPAMVSAVELLAEAAGATCYADAFLPAEITRPWRQRLTMLVRNRFMGAAAPKPPAPDQSRGDSF
jgi:3-phenylpropionate/trans-cinnamate dioxygenase ferredoxin reductase subunit